MRGFPITLEQPARHAGALPGAVDVVVIGGGIIGVMAAFHLAEAGRRVLLCEKGRVAGEQSGRNWGWIRQQGRDLAELPIMMDSLHLWRDLAREIGAERLGFHQEGVLYLACNAADMADYAGWAEQARGFGLVTELWGAAELERRLPGSAGGWIGGLFTPSDARAEPWVALPLIADLAVARGVILRENCAVRGLLRRGGAVAGVVTEAGEVACEQVILAGGAWSSLFLGNEGFSIPQLSVRASVGASGDCVPPFAGNAADDRFAFRPRADGGLTLAPGARHDFHIGRDAFRHFRAFWPTLMKDCRKTRFHPAAPRGFPDAWGTPRRWRLDRQSPFEAMRILNPAPNLDFLDEVAGLAAATLPGVGRPGYRAAWAGMIDTLPDEIPILGPVPGLGGLILATGMAGHGFGIGPGFGRALADLALGRPARHDLVPFRFDRFAPGVPRHIGTAL